MIVHYCVIELYCYCYCVMELYSTALCVGSEFISEWNSTSLHCVMELELECNVYSN